MVTEINESVDYQEGIILLVNKPLRWTSFDVVNKIRILLRDKKGLKGLKVGHAGTLDPLASGLMIVCTGKKTKEIARMQEYNKEYIATIEFGRTTPSFDLETAYDGEYPTAHITQEYLEKRLLEFMGDTWQVPPMHSARHIGGKRAYDLARKGESIDLGSQRIHIERLDLLKYDMPYAELRILCSKGTYIRSLARDIGKSCQSGAHLIALQRTVIGPYFLDQALSLEEFEKKLAT